MEISDLMYKKKFTAFGQMQSEKEIAYSVIYDNTASGYGVSITQYTKHTTETKAVKNISKSRTAAEKVLLFLYENAVSPAVLPDIMHDIVMGEMFDEEWH